MARPPFCFFLKKKKKKKPNKTTTKKPRILHGPVGYGYLKNSSF